MKDFSHGTAVGAERPPITVAEPMVAGGVLSSFRAAIIERDLWQHVRRSTTLLSARDEDYLDTACDREWVDFDAYVLMLDALAHTIGTDPLRNLVRRHIVDPAGASFYAPMMRSWARSFQAGPERMLRGAVHVFRSALRNAGGMQAVRESATESHLVLEGSVAAASRRSRAFAASIEGFGLGFVDLAQPRPTFVEVDLVCFADAPVLVCKWTD